MSIYLRGKTYWLRITTPDGQRVRKSTQTTDRRKAQEYHDKLKAELWRVYKLGEKPRRTWQEAALRWMDETSHKTDHKHDIEKLRWLDEYLGQCYLDEISRDLIDEISKVKRRTTSPTTVNRYLALIRSILRAARDEWEWLDRIPKIRLYKEPPGRVRWLKKEEARRLIDELPDHLAALASFSLATGLRRANATGLTWNRVNLDDRLAWIPKEQSKTKKAISVPLNDAALAIVKSQIGKSDEFVFVYQGNPIKQTSTKAWAAALRRAGIEDFRWHDLRHTWASWHVQNGTPLQELMELGAWKTYGTVLKYAHLSTGQLSAAANRIDAMF